MQTQPAAAHAYGHSLRMRAQLDRYRFAECYCCLQFNGQSSSAWHLKCLTLQQCEWRWMRYQQPMKMTAKGIAAAVHQFQKPLTSSRGLHESSNSVWAPAEAIVAQFGQLCDKASSEYDDIVATLEQLQVSVARRVHQSNKLKHQTTPTNHRSKSQLYEHGRLQ